ncbi:MAG: iron-sulfur cluster-binding protein [Rhodospirillaceae bacterium]|jgi:L-lactate dehydrogenase complex protein LldF|nr:iron-sulfur cluster-binding protein [Rhodospirillaceae bacterium]MBT5455884.1 iron-sulfur cluster-binding protein [Rhodospirillaceae bacterium]
MTQLKPAGFSENARAALEDGTLQRALGKLQTDFRADRAAMRSRLPEFDTLRDQATAIKNHALDNLDSYLEQFEKNVEANGGSVHWCRNAVEANETILALCNAAGASRVAKGKSMVSEEIGLNDYLGENGIDPIETDLGEYILQLRRERPSHVVMPAIHLNARQVGETFRDGHGDRDPARVLDDPDILLAEARATLRRHFLDAQVGITGANFLVAESGSAVLVTNEGNGDLVHSLPRTHIVLAGIEKIVPTLADAFSLVRVLARSATTQEITSYTSVISGPRRAAEADGPDAFHVVLLDNGRSDLLRGPFRDVLRCIRCGACQSLCPVYGTVGGHAYGAVYAGPIGAVLSPSLDGLSEAHQLPEASSFCGQCEEVCPVRIPLPDLMRRWREKIFRDRSVPSRGRLGIRLWAFAARHSFLYRLLQRSMVAGLSCVGRRSRRMPLAGGWTDGRDLPPPQGGTFVAGFRRQRRRGAP